MFDFFQVSFEDTKRVILSIRSNAVGCNEISRRLIITILGHILPAISYIVNFLLDSGTFSLLWHQAFIIPLPKRPNPSFPEHFQLISLLTSLSKVLQVCVHKQLSQFIYQHKLLSTLQSGFRPGHHRRSRQSDGQY